LLYGINDTNSISTPSHKLKKCLPKNHLFERVPKSAMEKLNDDSDGLGIKTWKCDNCGLQVKAS
jgi:hypothetical protein